MISTEQVQLSASFVQFPENGSTICLKIAATEVVNMPPTMAVDSVAPSSKGVNWANISDHRPVSSTGESSCLSAPLLGCGSTRLEHVDSRHMTLCSRCVIPEASPVFRETIDKMKLESSQGFCSQKGNIVAGPDAVALLEPTATPSPSFLSKLKSAFKSSSISPQLSPHRSKGLPSLSSTITKTGSSRRPASFGGSDVAKPSTERRASQIDKRVSWADEHGSNHPLFSVRLIRPRLSTDISHNCPTAPGHSILRNTGIF